MPPTHHRTELITVNEHFRFLHAGPQLMSAYLRQHYWVPGINQVIRSVLHCFLSCFKLKAAASQQLMGRLPLARVGVTLQFLNTGIDFMSPFEINSGNTTRKTTAVCYVTLFISMETKAIYLELLS